MKRSIRTLIVDDEPLARDAVRLLLADDPDIVVIGESRNGKEAVKMIQASEADLVFLDVQMPDLDGFQVIAQVGAEKMPVTVFVTAFEQHALRAFAANALDYILKPFDEDRFHEAVSKAKGKLVRDEFFQQSQRLLDSLQNRNDPPGPSLEKETTESSKPKYLERLIVKTGGRIFFIKTEDVDWIEAEGDYISLHVGNATHLVRETMNDLTAKLNPDRFLRIHRSTIVNVECVKEIQSFFGGEHIVTLKDGKKLKMSRSYRHKLEALLGENI